MNSPVKHIIIADDDKDDVEMFQDAVDETCPDLKLTIATDGAKLISLLDTSPKPDVIVLNLNMPLKSGKECMEEIRTKDEFDDVPIVILSTSNQKTDIDYCLTHGANHYFVKPNTIGGIKSIVENFCNGELFISV